MRKSFFTLMCLIAMMAAGTSLKAQEVTIVLNPGWTWISNPTTDTLDFATALGSFTPMPGDAIKSQWGNAYYRNGRWAGSISQFYPGYGFKYYSNRSVPVMLTMGTPHPQLSVTTAEPTDITAISAVVGSTVTVEEGNQIYVRGVCWGTEEMPTKDGSHTSGEAVAGSQNITLEGLSPSTTYYVRAYMVTDYGLAYGNQQSFTTESLPSYTVTVSSNPTEGGTVTGGGTYEQGQDCTVQAMANTGYIFTNWTEDGEVVSTDATYTFTVNADRILVANFDYAYVDLGLPSGLLWATCNVGANNPEDYGDYFAWGETTPKDTYNWSTYQHCMGSEYTMTKYCNDSGYGYNGFTDNLTTLLPEDDAATANWGSGWRMPTKEEWQELIDNTTVTWTTLGGDLVDVAIFTASNGNSLFLPVAGYRDDISESSGFISDGSFSVCWSSSLYTDFPDNAWIIDFGYGLYEDDRYIGHTVRAVRSFGQNNAPIGAIDGKFTINADGGQVYFSQGNLQYQASTNTWKFADNQYDYVGSTNSNISSTYSGWIDLFGWGTSGYDHGANFYQPWSTSQTESNYYAYGSYTYNLYDQTGQADWGYNPINNGGNQENQWRTLTQPEWAYVFNTRITSSGIRYAKANVNNVNGVILLPDDWSSSTYSLSNTNSSGASFSSNTISSSQWTTFEQAGAVFLPAAGYRSGTSVFNVGSYGYYWSASYGNSIRALNVYFGDSSLSTDNSYYRYGGRSVRLVCPAEN